MPICIECRYPVSSLYTTYSKADDRTLGKGVRLTQCPRCKRFADKYVEHDFVVLFIDLVLIKPQVGLCVLLFPLLAISVFLLSSRSVFKSSFNPIPKLSREYHSRRDQEMLYPTPVLIYTCRSTDIFCSTGLVEKMVASMYVSVSHVDESILMAAALHNTFGRLAPSVRRLLDLGAY